MASKNGRALLRAAPADTDDPYVIAARRRLARWEDLDAARLGAGERPYLVSEEEHRRIREAFAESGVTFLQADASAVTTEHEFLVLLGEVHAFPEYYGENWAAFLDCYADVFEADDAPLVLTVRGLDRLRDTDFRAFLRCVHELESATESVPLLRPVIPRKVVNLYVGAW
ncbi:barstar family protein [Streptomyces tritici]|uniref:barstar family protein n=1 Tax=Streptomyces tritici TaxID=2054410 RepID=UPI003AF1A077